MKSFVLNYVSLFLLLVLTADALTGTWWEGPLYSRIQLPLFYNAHATSILAIVLAGWYLAFYKKDGIAVAIFAVLGTASIHELTLDAVDLAVFHISSGIDLRYGIYLFAFLGVGYFVSKRYHKEIWFWTAGLMTVWFLVLTALPHGSTIDPNVPFGASADFYTWWVNLEEVASWIVPVSLWFLPRRWFLSGTLPWENNIKSRS